MFKATCNFMAGKGFRFNKGDKVFGDIEVIQRLISEGLVEEVPGPSVPDVKAALAEQDAKAAEVSHEIHEEKPQRQKKKSKG